MIARKKDLTPEGFRYPSLPQRSSGVGGNWGRIGPKLEYMPETEGKRDGKEVHTRRHPRRRRPRRRPRRHPRRHPRHRPHSLEPAALATATLADPLAPRPDPAPRTCTPYPHPQAFPASAPLEPEHPPSTPRAPLEPRLPITAQVRAAAAAKMGTKPFKLNPPKKGYGCSTPGLLFG